MGIQTKQYITIPTVALCAVMLMVTANIMTARSTSALSLGSLLNSLLGGGQQESKPTVSPSQTAPAQSTPVATPSSQVTPQSTSAQTTPISTDKSTQTATPSVAGQAAAPSAQVILASTDSTAAALATANAQAHKIDSSVQYTSARIDNEKRDRLYAVAASVSVVGAALYGMTLLQSAPRRQLATARRPLYIK